MSLARCLCSSKMRASLRLLRPAIVFHNIPNSTKRCSSGERLKSTSAPLSSVEEQSVVKSASLYAKPKMHYDNQFLRVYWKTGDDEIYPLVWLRNNCRCPKCYHEENSGRRILGRNLILEPTIDDISLNYDSNLVEMKWDDGHESSYAFDWLLENGFSKHRIEERLEDIHRYNMRSAWGREFKIPSFDFDQTVDTDEGLFKMITELKVHGLCILKNARGEDEPLCKMSDRLGYPLTTNYGHYFTVKSKDDPSNLAYTADTLGLHNDLTMLAQTPGIQMLHCITQSADIHGGDNFFSDALFAGRRLRNENREAFDILVNEKISVKDYGSDFVKRFYLRNHRPTFRVDENEDVLEVAYNHQIRDSKMVIEPYKVPLWFRAIYLLENTLMEEAIYITLKPGDVACFDNQRVLHGRNGFKKMTADADRYLRGVYYPWDITNSTYRRLCEKWAK